MTVILLDEESKETHCPYCRIRLPCPNDCSEEVESYRKGQTHEFLFDYLNEEIKQFHFYQQWIRSNKFWKTPIILRTVNSFYGIRIKKGMYRNIPAKIDSNYEASGGLDHLIERKDQWLRKLDYIKKQKEREKKQLENQKFQERQKQILEFI